MSNQPPSLFSRMSNRVLPRMPDFYGMILDQSRLSMQVAVLLNDYMQSGDKDKAEQIAQLEEEAVTLQMRNLAHLKSAFATPLDREDLYRAITSVDAIVPLAGQIIKNMSDLAIKPDAAMIDMVAELRKAMEALAAGYEQLAVSSDTADKDAQEVVKARAAIDKQYRAAIGNLYQFDAMMKSLQDQAVNAQENAMAFVLDVFKRREVYRLLHDAGNTMGGSGKVLHDIVVQMF